MKELIDVKFKLLWYIKFLEYMNMDKEVNVFIEYSEDNCIYLYGHMAQSLTDQVLENTHLEELILISKELEETYEFLPKWKDLNEYLYKLAIIKGFN